MTVLLALDSLQVLKAVALVLLGRTRTAPGRASARRAQREPPPLRQARFLVLFAQMLFRQGTCGMLLGVVFPALAVRTKAASARASVSCAIHLVYAPPARCPLQIQPAVWIIQTDSIKIRLLLKDARFWHLKGALCACHPVSAPLAGLLPQTGLGACCLE